MVVLVANALKAQAGLFAIMTPMLQDLMGGGDAVMLTTGGLEIAARTNNTQPDATVQNGGGSTPLLGGALQTYDAAVLGFTLKSKVKGTLRCAKT